MLDPRLARSVGDSGVRTVLYPPTLSQDTAQASLLFAHYQRSLLGHSMPQLLASPSAWSAQSSSPNDVSISSSPTSFGPSPAAPSHPQPVPILRAPPAPRTTTPTEQQHRVYTLECAHCETFLSDRGMRAVLLLKPGIVLFSTDATPLNSGPLFYEPATEAGEEVVERTCDCLTQSLGCHGCGAQIGYHIVAPCARCTQSVNKHQRSANGHRFVFHYGEVSARERRYVPGERGVLPNCYAMLARQSTPVATAPDPAGEAKFAPPAPTPSELPAPRVRRPLRGGDLVYWSHLRNGGERTEPIDPRSRPIAAPIVPGR